MMKHEQEKEQNMIRRQADRQEVRLAGGWDGKERNGEAAFGALEMEFLAEISALILKNRTMSEEEKAFGFWCRKRHLQSLAESYKGKTGVGRGMILHIAASNVPLLFAYSFAYGLLTGNGNAVRISGKVAEETKSLLLLFEYILKKEKYRAIYKRNLFFVCDHQAEFLKHCASVCDGQMVWGGDQAVKEMRKLDTPPGILRMEFADRCALAILDGEAVENMTTEERKVLAHRFYNDTYRMDQNACSSPGLVLWLNQTESAKKLFWNQVAAVAKEYELDAWKVSRKYEQLCLKAMRIPEICRVKNYGNRVYILELDRRPEALESVCKGIFGTFFEYDLENLEEAAEWIMKKTQTIVCGGVESQTVTQSLIRQQKGCVDRVVPMGQALAMERKWDGYDLFGTLAKQVEAETVCIE